jgi:hypothetical protein
LIAALIAADLVLLPSRVGEPSPFNRGIVAAEPHRVPLGIIELVAAHMIRPAIGNVRNDGAELSERAEVNTN